MTQEEFLLHYGVKGMKWGVRKAASGAGRYAKALGGNVALNVRHPILNNRAINANFKSSKTAAQKARKLTIGYKTKEIESINAKVKSQVAAKKSAKIQKDIDNLKSNKKKMLALKSKSGKPLFVEKDIDKMISGLESNKSKINAGKTTKTKAGKTTKAKAGKTKREQARIKKGKEKAKRIREQYGDKYTVTVDEKGKVFMKIGNETWKMG